MKQPEHTPRRIDLFCRIVDNYGDAGIGWRLGCLLTDELPAQVNLWIDHPAMLARWQRSRANTAPSGPSGPNVLALQNAASAFNPGDACISLLAADLPESVQQSIRAQNSLWIHYEYLTAEPWSRGCHALPSPLPSGGLTKWYFFPGFTEDSGGLLREHDLRERRRRFDRRAQLQWLAAHGLNTDSANPLRVCLFGYPDQPLQTLVGALEASGQLVQLVLHEKLFNDLGQPADSDRLIFTRHPWFDQADFDHLLWSCDLNIVRGEESWVRAHWAEKPFVWQPYRQAEDAHLPKLNAFLADLTGTAAQSCAARAIQGLTRALSPPDNRAEPAEMRRMLAAYLTEMPAIAHLHEQRSASLYGQTSAITRMQTFIEDQLQ